MEWINKGCLYVQIMFSANMRRIGSLRFFQTIGFVQNLYKYSLRPTKPQEIPCGGGGFIFSSSFTGCYDPFVHYGTFFNFQISGLVGLHVKEREF